MGHLLFKYAEHIQAVLKAMPGRRDRALEALTSLVNTMAVGEVPQEVAPFLCSARLVGIAKTDGGVRPIAVGGLLKRLVSRCCAVRLQAKAAAFLAPHQLGVGVRGGCEAIVHTVRKVLEADPTLLCLQADLVNCFNLVDRQVGMEEVVEEVEEEVKEALAFLKPSLAYPSAAAKCQFRYLN